MNTRSREHTPHLRLYDPDGMAATRAQRSAGNTRDTTHELSWSDELTPPAVAHNEYRQTALAIMRDLVSRVEKHTTSEITASLVDLPTGHSAIALPMIGKQGIYVAALVFTFNIGPTRRVLAACAEFLGGRLARRDENRAVLGSLLDYASSHTGPPSLENGAFLAEYENYCVLDARGSVYCQDGKVMGDNRLLNAGRDGNFFLFVFDDLGVEQPNEMPL